METTPESEYLSTLTRLIAGRNSFLTNDTLRSLDYRSRSSLVSRFMLNEIVYMDMINRMYQNDTYLRNAAATLLTFTLPTTGAMEPVYVTASQTQISSSLIDCPASGNCAICQDAISSGACRIRQCGHIFHRSCVQNWFSMSVRCPVCRHDIREENQVNQTTAASS